MKCSMSRLLLLVLLCQLFGCCQIAEEQASVQVTLLHMNDVYELMPLDAGDGSMGGLARVAALERRLTAENPNTITVLSGDMLSPSALGLAKIQKPGESDAQRMAGEQMVAVMNELGLDVITYGNHEFDLKEQELLDRLGESKFTWLGTNVRHKPEGTGEPVPFPNTVKNKIIEIEQNGSTLKLGIFGLTLDSNPKDWVTYDNDYRKIATAQEAELRRQGADVVIALTHLAIIQDVALAAEVPGIDLILGGHEHENIALRRGLDMTPVYKADANARTVYIHRLAWNPNTKKLAANAELKVIDDSIEPDPTVRKLAESWQQKGFEAFRKSGFDPEKKVVTAGVDLDGREASVRQRPTDLTELFAAGIQAAGEGAQAGIFNGGMIRIDDVIPQGQLITNYDILRILPFEDTIVMVRLEGKLLRRMLDVGVKNRGKGGFLQNSGLERKAKDGWLIAGQPLKDDGKYLICINEYLLSGKEENLDFLSSDAVEQVAQTKEETARSTREVLRAALIAKFEN